MLVSLTVTNFRSFFEEQTFSLVASKRINGAHEGHAVPIPGSDERVLRAAVIYGANGAGKSNLLKALRYTKIFAMHPRPKSGGTGREAFRFADGPPTPSSFDLHFIADDKLYRFGFTVDDDRVIEEWLQQISGNRERSLYTRKTDQHGKVDIKADGFKEVGKKLHALATVGGPPNQSFLATIVTNLAAEDYGQELASIINWFSDDLTVVGPNDTFSALGNLLTKNTEFLHFAGEFLRSASTGIHRLNTISSEMPDSELRSVIPETLLTRTVEELDEDGTSFSLGDGTEVHLEKSDTHRAFRIRIEALHNDANGKEIPLSLTEESDGTRRLLHLLPALYYLKAGRAVFFIDEIDRSMHPSLIIKFIEYFLEVCKAGRRQIILTTHETNLLNLDLLRRDEIWFAEKNNQGATHLYSLTDFKVRKDLEVRKNYLEGRFGAIPFLGDLDQIIDGSHEAA
jgi:AAA15 family ATPase/GTPase